LCNGVRHSARIRHFELLRNYIGRGITAQQGNVLRANVQSFIRFSRLFRRAASTARRPASCRKNYRTEYLHG
jgi:hypothetical protein